MSGRNISAVFILLLAAFAVIPFCAPVRAAAQTETVLFNFQYDFNYDVGFSPLANLTFDSAGNLYGTNFLGGVDDRGTAYELSPGAGGIWTATVLHDFGTIDDDGNRPTSTLAFDSAGNLYGTCTGGGSATNGTVFQIKPGAGGTWSERTIYSFGHRTTKDGWDPNGQVTLDSSHHLFGTTIQGGGLQEVGFVFELTPEASGIWSETKPYVFGENPAVGAPTYVGVILDSAGNLYGSSFETADGGGGAVYKLSPASGGGWTSSALHTFGSGTDGANPGAIVFGPGGAIFGATYAGGTYGGGTIFELTPNAGGGWSETILHSFGNGSDGSSPFYAPVIDAAGNVYGSTEAGGTAGVGIVFQLTPSHGAWTETILHNFTSDGTDGYSPNGLTLGADGNLYGTTPYGGIYGGGTVFEITP